MLPTTTFRHAVKQGEVINVEFLMKVGIGHRHQHRSGVRHVTEMHLAVCSRWMLCRSHQQRNRLVVKCQLETVVQPLNLGLYRLRVLRIDRDGLQRQFRLHLVVAAPDGIGLENNAIIAAGQIQRRLEWNPNTPLAIPKNDDVALRDVDFLAPRLLCSVEKLKPYGYLAVWPCSGKGIGQRFPRTGV